MDYSFLMIEDREYPRPYQNDEDNDDGDRLFLIDGYPIEEDWDGDTVFDSVLNNNDSNSVMTDIADCLYTVAHNCPNLQTFTLHLLSDFIMSISLGEPWPKNLVADALSALTVRDTLMVIAVSGPKYSPYTNILKDVAADPEITEAYISDPEATTASLPAPTAKWTMMELRSWPQISLTSAQQTAISDLIEKGSDHEARIKLWHFEPATSKGLCLPSRLNLSRHEMDCEYMEGRSGEESSESGSENDEWKEYLERERRLEEEEINEDEEYDEDGAIFNEMWARMSGIGRIW